MHLKNRIEKLEEIARQDEPPYFITAFSAEEAQEKVKEYWKENPYGREPEITIFKDLEELHRGIEKNIKELLRLDPELSEEKILEDFLKWKESQQPRRGYNHHKCTEHKEIPSCL
jgi:hypothetical protein